MLEDEPRIDVRAKIRLGGFDRRGGRTDALRTRAFRPRRDLVAPVEVYEKTRIARRLPDGDIAQPQKRGVEPAIEIILAARHPLRGLEPPDGTAAGHGAERADDLLA